MNEEKMFCLNEISFSNLDILSKEQSERQEARICELSFIADGVAEQAVKLLALGISMYEVLTLLSEELTLAAPSMGNEVPEVTRSAVAGFLSALSCIDKASFASLLKERLSERGYTVSERDFLPETDALETFSYVKNALSDEAFDVFSQEFSDPRIVYADSFKEACFAVADGKTGYCILPFEESGGVRIPTISSLVSALDLKIVAITPVFGLEGSADMKYALVGRGFSVPERGEGDERYLEIDISREPKISLGTLISASEYLQNSAFRVSTTLRDSEDASTSYSIIFKDDGGSFTELLIFLTLFAGAFTPVGIYKNIE